MAQIFKSGLPEKDRVIEPSADPSRQLSVFERKMQQVQDEVDSLRCNAKREAEGIVAQASEKAGKIKSDAYNEGLEKGKSEAVTHIEQLAASLRGEIENLATARITMLKQCKGNIVDFSLKLAKLIINGELKTNPAMVEKQLERIFERITVDGRVDIFISSEDFETIETFLKETGSSLTPDGYELKVDTSLGRGGVKVETSDMGVDGSIEGMLSRVEVVVRDLLNEDG